MRPDRHKQAASRRYQAKAKARDGSSATSASTPGTGHGNPGTHHSRMAGHERHATQDDLMNDKDEEADYVSLKKYSRRKVVSNLDRYVEESEEVNEAEELELGIDRQTMAFEELLLDSDQKHSFAEAAYFRFKSEKAAEDLEASVSTGSGLAADDNQHAQKWMEIRLDDLETSLMRLSFSDRLYLSEADQGFYEYDDASLVDDYTTQGASGGKVSFKAGTPIVPKLVRGEAAADILIQPSETTARVTAAAKSTAPVQQPSPAPGIKQLSNAETRRQQAKASKDQELDDLLDQSKRTVQDL
ncbi:hypothetical protein DFQ26_002418 [Actinomortierella ambigua]|nr:hypothetical protein DFQ26_002418 [Actinomortierella ambigua]